MNNALSIISIGFIHQNILVLHMQTEESNYYQ